MLIDRDGLIFVAGAVLRFYFVNIAARTSVAPLLLFQPHSYHARITDEFMHDWLSTPTPFPQLIKRSALEKKQKQKQKMKQTLEFAEILISFGSFIDFITYLLSTRQGLGSLASVRCSWGER